MSDPTPDIIEALYASVKAAFAGNKRVAVYDGPPTVDVDRPDAVGIAVNVESGGEGPAQAGRSFNLASQQMSLDLACVAESWTGDAGLSTPRRRAFALLDQMTPVLDELRGQHGVVDARIPEHTYTPIRGENGLVVSLEFVVHLDIYRKD